MVTAQQFPLVPQGGFLLQVPLARWHQTWPPRVPGWGELLGAAMTRRFGLLHGQDVILPMETRGHGGSAVTGCAQGSAAKGRAQGPRTSPVPSAFLWFAGEGSL